MKDIYGRKIDYLRISITDRCNLKCIYCIPKEGISYYPSEQLLSKDEILRIVSASAKLGISKIKITGGEPLIRKDVVEIISGINQIEGIDEITMTTNGVLLKELAQSLKDSGLSQLNISLDSMSAQCFKSITLVDQFEKVYEGMLAALDAGIKVKINCVPIKGLNDQEIVTLVQKTNHLPIAIRFIELMPIGEGRTFEPIMQQEVLDLLKDAFGEYKAVHQKLGNGPAVYYQFEKTPQKIGFITALSNEFCSQCNRIRLTCNGQLKLCLHYAKGINLKEVLATNISDEALVELLNHAIYNKKEKHLFKDKNDTNELLEEHSMVQIGG